jgi:serine/threonine protein kinase
MTPTMAPTFFSIIGVLLAVAGGIVVLVMGTILVVKFGVGLFSAIGAVFGRIFEFIGGVIGDAIRLVGATVTAVVFVPLVLLNVMIGRWSAANHFANAFRTEIGIVGHRAWSLAVRRPLRLVFLEGLLEGVEQRAVEAVRQAPGPDRPKRGMEFPGFEVTGSLPAGGSGAKLYIARPDDATKRRLVGSPDEVVIKSFALAEGSSLPQIVRESRSLDAARRLGLVLAHELNDTRFWYAMPYHPGDNLTAVVRQAHAFADDRGLGRDDLGQLVGYAIDLVATLDRYHAGGMWHKDVKPDNIIVHDAAAHLVDFGLVSSLKSAMTLTTHGTEYFRDPEMVRLAMKGVKVHEVNGAKFDVYGAGAVLYFMLENTFPAHGGLSRFEGQSPEALRMIVRRAMADYAHRYESAAAMLADLRVVAAASDPWSVKPGMLPSMADAAERGDVAEIEPEVIGVASAATPRRPAPPPISRGRSVPPVADRPAIQVANWLTGAYAAEPDRPRARDQVRAARSRADARRRAVAAPGNGRLSGVLVVLVLGVITAVVGTMMFVSPDDVRYVVRSAADISADGHAEIADANSLSTALDYYRTQPARTAAARTIIIDDQVFPASGHATSVAESLAVALGDRGWTVLEDPADEARARVSWSGDRSDVAVLLTSLDLEVIYWVRPEEQGDLDRVRIERYDGTESEAMVVDLTIDGKPVSQGVAESAIEETLTVTHDISTTIDRTPLHGVVERLGRLADRLETRFHVSPGNVRIHWASTPDPAIVMPNVPAEFVN